MIIKYAKLIFMLSFNDINSILISRVKGSHLLMRCLMAYTSDLNSEEDWSKYTEFVEHLILAISGCLRLSKTVSPFLKDSKKYLIFLCKIL